MDNKQMEEIHEMAQITLGKQVTIECTKYAIEEGFFDNFIALYNAGYRKIYKGSVVLTKEEYTALKLIEEYHIKSCGKNSVVLTEEEYEKLKSLYDSQKGAYMTSSIGDLPLSVEGLRKAVDEISRLLIVQAELQELNIKYYNEAKDLRREVDRLKDQARKQAIKEFAKRLITMAYQSVDWSHGAHPMVVEVDDIDELLEEFGVEL